MTKSPGPSTSATWTCPSTPSWWLRCLTVGAASTPRLIAGRTVMHTFTHISSVPVNIFPYASFIIAGNNTKNNTFNPSFASHSFLLRVWDLEKQEKQLKHYQQCSTSLEDWIHNARKRQDTLQSAKLSDIQTLMDRLNQQKARLSLFTSIYCY